MSAAIIERAMEPVIGEILRHGFITGLSDGRLPRAAFRRFLIQDGLFLRDYARALALAAARAADSADVRMLCRHAAEALDVERELHDHLVERLGIGADEIAAAEPSPTCLGYGSFLVRACATGDRAEALAAIAPCFLIYRRVGEALAAGGSPDPAYAEWIATYDGEAFGAATQELAGACDRALAGIAGAAREAARAHARTAARYEWMFWDAALRGESWPVA